jgi:hypothetical protein
MPTDPHTVIVKREELYEQVWSKPLRDVAREYRVSDVALKKICRKLDVPVPPQGFWARKAVGREGPRPPLPAVKDGQPVEHRIELRRDPVADAELGPEAKASIARERDPDLRVVVPNVLSHPHPLVTTAAGLLRKNKDAFVRRRLACLDISATGDALERALRIMDALVRAMEQRGFRVEVTKADQRGRPQPYANEQPWTPSRTGVWVAESFVEFGIREDADTIEIPPPPSQRGRRLGPIPPVWEPRPTTERRPNGKLTLSITNANTHGARKSWSDGKRQRLEDCLNDFIAGVVEAADRQRIARIEAERWRREWEERERRRAEELQRQEEEARWGHDLDSRAQDWAHVRVVREFLLAVESHAATREGVAASDIDIGRWLAWARRRADQIEADAIRTVGQLRPRPPGSPHEWIGAR